MKSLLQLDWSFSSDAVGSFYQDENIIYKGKVIVALIEFERVPYKGFGNLVWKSFMSGMMNTMIPFGKRLKESEVLKEKRKQEHKQAKKNKRRQ